MDSIEARHNNLLLLLASSIWYRISLPDVIIDFITGKKISFTNYASSEIVCGILWESNFILKRDFCSYRWKRKPGNSLAYLEMIKHKNETSSIIKMIRNILFLFITYIFFSSDNSYKILIYFISWFKINGYMFQILYSKLISFF